MSAYVRSRFDWPMLRQIITNGLPAGVQNSIISLANVVVQSHINSFGKMAVAGSGSYAKIEGFGFLPITCFALAMTTYISQIWGLKSRNVRRREPDMDSYVRYCWQKQLVSVSISSRQL